MFFANIGGGITHRMTRSLRKLVYDGYNFSVTPQYLFLKSHRPVQS
jgi:hypothetical protein